MSSTTPRDNYPSTQVTTHSLQVEVRALEFAGVYSYLQCFFKRASANLYLAQTYAGHLRINNDSTNPQDPDVVYKTFEACFVDMDNALEGFKVTLENYDKRVAPHPSSVFTQYGSRLHRSIEGDVAQMVKEYRKMILDARTVKLLAHNLLHRVMKQK